MAKGKAVWWVLTQNDDGVFIRQYSGPDRKRAREVASKLLSDEKRKEEQVVVARISRVSVLSDSSLKRVLPKDAF